MSSGGEVWVCFRCKRAVGAQPCPSCGEPGDAATVETINRLVTALGGKIPVPLPSPAQKKEDALAEAERRREQRRKERDQKRRESDERERDRHRRRDRGDRREGRDGRDGRDGRQRREERDPAEHPDEGVHGLAVADDQPIEEGLRVAIYENLGWFLGAFLVLAGSIYGVREAWLRLDAAGRYLVIGSAFLIYHAAFVLFAALLARRSARTGRIMAFVALGLLPVTTTAFANLARASWTTGVGAALVFAALAYFTVSNASRRFISDASRLIPIFVLAPMLAELILPQLGDASVWRFLIPLLGLAVCAAANYFLPPAKSAAGILAVIFYAAVALKIFALTSDSSEATGELTRWRTHTAWFGAWIAAWTAGLGFVVTASRNRAGAWAAAIELGGVALSMIATFASAVIALGAPEDDRRTVIVAAATAGLAALHAWWLARRRPALIHVYIPMFAAAAALALRAIAPQPHWAPLGCVAVAIAVQHLLRAPLWVIGLGALGVAATGVLEPEPIRQVTAAAFAALGISSHAAGFRADRRWHYFAALLASIAVAIGARAWLEPSTQPLQLLALAVAYGLAASLIKSEDEESPFDDASLIIGVVAIVWSCSTPAPSIWAPAFVYARAYRDKSRVVALAGLIGAALVAIDGLERAGPIALYLAVFGAANAIVAALLEDGSGDDTLGRSLFGRFELPLAGAGRRLAARASATAALGAAGVAVILQAGWLIERFEPDRTAAIQAGLAAIAVPAIGFFSRAFLGFRLRGSNAILWMIAPVVALTAIVNRIGRPLPPEIVARNLTIIVIALWLVALALRRWGPKLGAKLRAEESGAYYHAVPHTGVAALGILLLVDAALLAEVPIPRALSAIPPLMLGGGGLAWILMGRSFSKPGFITTGLIFASGAAALAAAQNLDAGENTPRLIQHAILGASIAVAAYGISAAAITKYSPPISVAAWIVAGALALISFWASDLWGAVAVLVGLSLISGRRLTLPAAGVLLIHAFSQAQPAVPFWVGPAIALLGAAAALRTHAAAIALVLGAIYALATGGTNVELYEGEGVLRNIGDWNLPFASVLAIAAASSFAGAYAWNAAATRPPAMGLAALGVLLCAWSSAITAMLLAGSVVPWTLFALAVASTAALAHVARMLLSAERFVDFASGLALGRDLALAIAALLLYVATQAPAEPALGLAAVAIAVAVSAGAAFLHRSALHIYFVETGVLGAYGYIRAAYAQALRPEHDALVILGLGYLLLGVIIFARRADIPPLSAATRRFAAALPFVLALVVPWETSIQTAIYSGASGLFYAALGWVERSRLFGALGAIAGNLAVLVLALSQGLLGIDIYVVPLGLCLVLLTHVFDDELDRRTRMILRFIAAGLVYAPAAITLVLQVGNAERELYPLVFGLGSMVGILVGMLLHIRAYLVLGTTGLCLDVIAHLVRASLRNQMLGFFLLSAAGISILALMVTYTLKKAAAQALLRKWRVALRGWD